MDYTALIAAIIDGRFEDAVKIDSRLRVDHQPLYSGAEFQAAAQYARDNDTSDLEYMLRREESFQAFQEWQSYDFDRRQFDDFDDWPDRMLKGVAA